MNQAGPGNYAVRIYCLEGCLNSYHGGQPFKTLGPLGAMSGRYLQGPRISRGAVKMARTSGYKKKRCQVETRNGLF